MKTTIIRIVAGILLCLPVLAQATNNTPTSNYGYYLDLNAFHTGIRPHYAETLGENNFTLAVMVCATAMDTNMDPADYVPESTFISVKDKLMRGAGSGINHSHGSSAGWGVQFYPHCEWGDSLRTVAVNEIISLGWGGEIGLSEDPGEYYAISILYSGYGNYMSLSEAIIYNQTCHGKDGGQWPGSAVTVAPDGICTGSDSESNDEEFGKNMGGGRGIEKRYVEAALDDCPNLDQLGTDGNRTLTPAVSGFSHSSGYMIPEGGQTTFTFTTDTHCNTGIPAFGVDGDLQLISSSWTSTTSFQATVGGYQVGSGYLMMNGHSLKCVSLPMADEYWVWIRHGSDGNTGASFEKFAAFNEGEETHISWVTNPEDGSLFFEVYGGPNRQTLLATVPAAGSLVRPHYYEVTVPIGYNIFEVVETDNDPDTEYTSRPFRLQHKPEDIAQLRQLNQEVMSWPSHDVDAEPAEGAMLAFPPVDLADFVFYSSRSDLLTQTYPVRDALENLGYSVEVTQWSSDPYEVRATMEAVYEQAIAENYPRLPTLVIIGEANQGDHPERNIVGTIYVDDQSGNCYWPGMGCSSDALIVDFDGDEVGDIPWTRVVASTNAEMSNCVESTMGFFNGNHIASPRRALFLNGDLTMGCDADPNDPRRTLLEVKALYDDQGLQTTILHESDYDCWDFDARLADASAEVNSGVSEVIGSGLITSFNRWPGFFFQRATSPYFTMDDIPTPQRVRVYMPGCGIANCDADVSDYPSIVKRWMVADPDQYTTAVSVYGASNGGYRSRHMQFAEEFFGRRFQVSRWDHLHHFLGYREINENDPYAYEYTRFLLVYGFPLPNDPMSVVGVNDPEVPVPREAVLGNWPNPFNPSTIISYSLTGVSRVNLHVYDVAGRRVTNLISNKVQIPDEYRVTWNGRDDNDRQMASGVYFAVLDISGHTTLAHKMTLLK